MSDLVKRLRGKGITVDPETYEDVMEAADEMIQELAEEERDALAAKMIGIRTHLYQEQQRAERAEFERDDANRLLKQGWVAAHQPDPLGEALNSGDGSYRP